MSWLGWGSSTNPQYEELVEKACSPLNLPYPQSEDISVNLEITDMIRSKTVLPKPAMQSLKRRIASRNGRVQMYALSLIDTCIKNGGDHFLAEIASKEFVDEMSGLIRSPLTEAGVKQMALKYFQIWALAFKSKRELSFLVDVYEELKRSNIPFPPPDAPLSSALLATNTAPAWVDSDVCMRCRSAFTFTNRKHHCRNCGLVYDQQCSSRTMALPHFGITEPVRVCETCYLKNPKVWKSENAPAVPGRTPRSKADFDRDLQRAIELSLKDVQPSGSGFVGSEPPLARNGRTAEDDDEELRLAIEASLREMEKARPSAPTGTDEPEYRPLPTFDLNPRETETILTFSNTMDQMAAYGERDLRRFPQAHMLFEQAYAIGGKLHRNVEEKATKQQMLAEMQAKLSEAVQLYGTILDGQQAFAARRAQEAQQRQYQQQQQSYAQTYPAYPYDNRYASPLPQANGYAPYAGPSYAPPQAAPAPAAPSLYPSMPNMAAPQIYPAQQQWQPPQQQAYQPNLAPAQPYGDPQYSHSHPSLQYASAPPQQAGVERHQSLSSRPTAQRTASLNYASTAPPTHEGPPPIDISSHPVSSSPQSNKSSLPAPVRSASYNSPVAINGQLPTSPIQQTPHQLPLEHQQHYAPAKAPQQQYQQQQYSAATQQAAPAQQPQQQQQQQQQQHLYYDTSFPQAPAAVFPDAPQAEPQGLEKKEKEEQLLIEL